MLYENGAQLSTPARLRVDTNAMGRGTYAEIIRRYAALSGRVAGSTIIVGPGGGMMALGISLSSPTSRGRRQKLKPSVGYRAMRCEMIEAPTWILYDGECRLCATVARWARAVHPRRRIQIRPIQEAGDLLGGLPAERALSAVHVVTPDGRVTTGGDAVPAMIEAFPAGGGLAHLVRDSPAIMTYVRRAYGLVMRVRDVLTCRVDASASSAGPCP
jgi:predicted DCC family thiol-disulfide oxidoreductase YuxK